MKFRYKILIVLAVFIGALFVFSGGIKQTVFSTVAQTTDMEASTLPTISFVIQGVELNRLHGYVSNTDEMVMRETITPMTIDKTFTVLIDDHGSNVRKLKYEIYTEDGRLLDSDSYTVLDVEDGNKQVDVTLNEALKTGSEYVAKITLITRSSKRIYFYTRLKAYENGGHLFEKLDFVKSFHDTLLHGTDEEREKLKKYLEYSKRSDDSTYADVNIKSSYRLVNYGELNPTVLWEEVPTINEYYDSMATMVLRFIVSVDTDYGTEVYVVNEKFRFNYTTLRTYLYNYERSMETIYDVSNTSQMKNEFKLGITSDIDAQTGASPSKKFLAFVFGRELMMYRVADNTMIKVFSFREGTTDYAREFYDNHEVKLLNVYDSGNVDFVVYGYMNRGEYEGRVGIVLYRYYAEDNRIEEQLYIPVETGAGILMSDLADFFYLNERNIFYFSLYDSIYAYDLITKQMQIIASDVPEDNLIYVEEENYIAWQNASNRLAADKIMICRLDTGEIDSIDSAEGEVVRILGRINNNIIYGYSLIRDAYVYPDGDIELPCYKMCIADKTGNVLKTYEEEGIFVNGISIGDNIIMLDRLIRSGAEGSAFTETEKDSIINRIVPATKPVSITKRVTDKVLTEYYVSIPSGINIEKVPAMKNAVSTVINRSTTTRLAEPRNRTLLYYAYSFGDVVYASSVAKDVIHKADELVGTVINKDGRLIWERGVRANKADISGIVGVRSDENLTTLQAVLQMMMNTVGNKSVDAATFDRSQQTAYEWLRDNMTGATPIDLTGATLDEALYYVYKDRPVLAIDDTGKACLITGYDKTSVFVYGPELGRYRKYDTAAAQKMFEKYGNIFISYVK